MLANTSFYIAQCLNLIVYKFQEPNNRIFFLSTFVVDFPIVRKHIDLHWNSNEQDITQARPKFYIVEYAYLKQMDYYLSMLRLELVFNPKAKFIFIGSDITSNHLDILVKANIYNAVFISVQTGKVYTYFPFKKRNLRQLDMRLVEIWNCFKNTSGLNELFPEKIPNHWIDPVLNIFYSLHPGYTNCHQCKMPGVELEIYESIFSRLKIQPSFSKIVSSSQIATFLSNTQQDLMIGTFFLNIFSYRVYEATMSYIPDEFKIYVPAKMKLPRWRFFIDVFNMEIWISWAFSFSSIGLIWMVISFMKHSERRHTFGYISVFMEGRTTQFRNIESSREILMFIMIFLTFFITAFFNCRLLYLLNGVNYYKGIQNLEDIMENHLTIKVGTQSLSDIMKRVIEKMNYSHENVVLCEIDFYLCLKVILTDRNTAFVLSTRFMSQMSFFDKRFLKFEPLESISTLNYVGYFHKGHPLYHAVNKFLNLQFESGINKKIRAKYEVPTFGQSVMEPIQKLKLTHLIAPIFIMGVGLALSSMVFQYECIIFKLIHSRDEKFRRRH